MRGKPSEDNDINNDGSESELAPKGKSSRKTKVQTPIELDVESEEETDEDYDDDDDDDENDREVTSIPIVGRVDGISRPPKQDHHLGTAKWYPLRRNLLYLLG